MTMSILKGPFTSESVSSGHPDKLCDRISDAILDEFLSVDPTARVACETFACRAKILVAGEFRTGRPDDFEMIKARVPERVRQVLCEVGYGTAEQDIDPKSCETEVRFNHQSGEIAAGVDGGEALGAGDQGLMFGYATDETPWLTPLAWTLATQLIERGSMLRQAGDSPLRPDAKSQVTVQYSLEGPPLVSAVVVSWQQAYGIRLPEFRAYLEHEIIDTVIPRTRRTPSFRVYCNPAGDWHIGGPRSDTGLTGRKIIVDTYGGSCPHGGGAFSGKDPSKVDRSAAYAARWVAKNVVAAGIARRCTVQLSYAIGVAEPVSIAVDTHDNHPSLAEAASLAVRDVFNLTPSAIIRDLDLLRPIYRETSSLGHFGPFRDPARFPWERTDRAEALAEAFLKRSAGSVAFANELKPAAIGLYHGDQP
jgi:S-adenosylmethionine synthetase